MDELTDGMLISESRRENREVKKLMRNPIVQREFLLAELVPCGSVRNVCALLKEGVDRDIKETRYLTKKHIFGCRIPLSTAVQEGNVDMVKGLLDAGASVNDVDYEKKTTLYYAVGRRDSEIIELLIKARAITKEKNKFGETFLHDACRNGLEWLARLLLTTNLPLNAQNNAGCTALHLALSYGHGQIAIVLIKAGADVNIKDKNGTTPLLELLMNEPENLRGVKKKGVRLEKHDVILLECLIAAGANVNTEDNFGQTPASIILNCPCKNIDGTCFQVLKLLLKKGASLHRSKSILFKEAANSSYSLSISRLQYLGAVLYKK